MTLSFEKFNAIKQGRRILWAKYTDNTNLTDKISLTREEVYSILKHYPFNDWVEKLERLYDSYIKEGRREEIENERC